MPLRRVEGAPCSLLLGSWSELGQKLIPVFLSFITTFGLSLNEYACGHKGTFDLLFSLEHAGEQSTGFWFLCCGLARCWLSEIVSVLFLVLITVARAGSKLLSSLSTKTEFYSEPICSDNSAPASGRSWALASISFSVPVRQKWDSS